MVRKLLISTVSCLIILLVTQNQSHATSGSSSTGSSERPGRNIYGTITDIENNFFPFEYLAVGSRTETKKIPVYTEPNDPDSNPAANTTYIDLDEIVAIKIADPEKPTDNIVTFEGREYVRILVIFKNNAEKAHPYIIEKKTAIYCDEDINQRHKVARSLRFDVIKKITITGFKSADRVATTTPSPAAKPFDEKKFHNCSQAQQDLKQLSDATKQLPAHQQGILTPIIEQIKDWVGALCNN